MQIKKILLPVDGSTHSMRAAEYAIELGGLIDIEIVLLYCHKPFPVILGEPYYQSVINQINKDSNELIAPFKKRLDDSGVKTEIRILDGSPGKIIPEIAKIEKSDMIIMGSRGRSDLQGLLLGSVTHRVLHAAECPVLVIK